MAENSQKWMYAVALVIVGFASLFYFNIIPRTINTPSCSGVDYIELQYLTPPEQISITCGVQVFYGGSYDSLPVGDTTDRNYRFYLKDSVSTSETKSVFIRYYTNGYKSAGGVAWFETSSFKAQITPIATETPQIKVEVWKN